jgi:hypothetical protein
MAHPQFKVWRIVEEQESSDRKHRVITRKEYVGEIESPRQEIYLTWNELAENLSEGYYLVEVPAEICRKYLMPDKQYIRTPAYFEPGPLVKRDGNTISYKREFKSKEEILRTEQVPNQVRRATQTTTRRGSSSNRVPISITQSLGGRPYFRFCCFTLHKEGTVPRFL